MAVIFKKYYLVINLGLRSIRVVLFDQDGNIFDKDWYPVQTFIKGDCIEQNPEEWWNLSIQLLTRILDRNIDCKKNLKYITITSSACCLVLVGKSGKTLMNSLLVMDKRAKEQAEVIKQEETLTGIFQNSNYLASPSFMFPKILWLKENLHNIYSKASFFMSSNDFFIYKLTGQVITDTLNAEKFYYDPKKQEYPQSILNYIGIQKENLPKVVGPGTAIGHLKKELQKQLGLSENVRVVASTYDAICAFLGSGALTEGEACNVSGTVSSVRAFAKKKMIHQNGIFSQKFGDFNIVGGSNNIDGGLLEWAKRMFYGDSYSDKYIYKIMEDEARLSSPGSKGLIFLPYLLGERFPFFDNAMRGIFFGLERFHTRSDIIHSIFEATGFMVHDILLTIESLGIKINTIRMSGGVTKNQIVCKIRANITGKRILVIDEIETTSLGAFFILLLADKAVPNFQKLVKRVRIKEEYKPDWEKHKKYQQIYRLFKQIYQRNRNLMFEREKLLQRFGKDEQYILDNL